MNASDIPASVINLNFSEGRGVVCAWCEDKEAGDRLCLELGLQLSHGMCPHCVDGFKEQVRCERASRNPFSS